jgi:DNA helicase-2/ATP-dependent DNA helicase PcrA
MQAADEGFVLSAQQQKVVARDANFLLKACPGSGKTHTIAARIARLMSDGASIAACSYTNVGVDAVRKALAAHQRSVIEPRHFVGTLHGFLLRHVTYPFGHLTFGVTMRLLRDESSIWPAVDISDAVTRRVALPLFRMRPDGSMRLAQVPQNVGLPPSEVLRRGEGRARTLKREMAARGWISSDDAMYIALRVLREQPDITRAVAGRYNELLVDEAQDTSELQLECLRLLASSGGLQSVVLIGDPEQAISSYAGASAQGCDQLAKHCGLTTMSLTENYRSSQKICDLAFHFSSRALPDAAVGRDAAHPLVPQFVVYPAEQPRHAVTTFTERLEQLGEDALQSAILVRSNGFRDEVNGVSGSVRILPRPLSFGRAVARVRSAHTLDRRDVEQIDRIVSYAAFDDEELTGRLPHER